MSEPTRREALKGAAAIAMPLIVPASALGKDGPAPSNRIALGAIGVNGMGLANLNACGSQPDVTVVGLCDVNRNRLAAAAKRYEATAKTHRDWRELIARTDVDALTIATPPHWHTLMAIEAAKAGKHIYLQKPMTLYPAESLAVRNAVRKHKIVAQVGTQIHAGANYRRCVEWVRSGKLGKISVVRTFNVMNQGPDGIGRAPVQEPPAHLDWEMWLGPGPKIPYNSILEANSFNHCWFQQFTGGWTPGMAPHILDLPVWALELGLPETTFCAGQSVVTTDDGDAPDSQEVTWRYPNCTLTWSMSTVNSFAWDFGRGTPARRIGIYFHGVNGTLIADYGRCEIVPEGKFLADATAPPATIPPSPGHEREWLNCIKSGEKPSCHPDYHHKVDLPICLANLSYRLGRAIQFDPKTEQIVGDEEARKLAVPVYREPWRFPVEYLTMAG
jgi:predicted dehydrogenase